MEASKLRDASVHGRLEDPVHRGRRMKAVGGQEGAAVEDRPPGGLGASRPGGGPNPWVVPCLLYE
jgi:hypothetical protein